MGTAGHEVGSGRRVESATAADHLGCAGVCSPSSHEATPRMANASTFPGSNECSLNWYLQGNMAPQALTQHARGGPRVLHEEEQRRGWLLSAYRNFRNTFCDGWLLTTNGLTG